MSDFKEILDSLPEKPPRSRLEPYRDLILEMRRRGRSFREIAQVLGEKCGVCAVPSTIHDFVKAARSQVEDDHRMYAGSDQGSKAAATLRNSDHGVGADEIQRRIAALKAREIPPDSAPERFQFISGEPLRLPIKPRRKE